MVKATQEKLRTITFNENVKKGDTEIPKEMGGRLKQLRDKRDLTCTQLAKLSGISTSYISRIENGERERVSYQIIEDIANALDVEPEVLTGKKRKKLISIQELLVTDDYLIKGELPSLDARIKLAELFNVLLDCEWEERSKHKDSVDIFYRINDFLVTVK